MSFFIVTALLRFDKVTDFAGTFLFIASILLQTLVSLDAAAFMFTVYI